MPNKEHRMHIPYTYQLLMPKMHPLGFLAVVVQSLIQFLVLDCLQGPGGWRWEPVVQHMGVVGLRIVEVGVDTAAFALVSTKEEG
jgi:hypothetical protein